VKIVQKNTDASFAWKAIIARMEFVWNNVKKVTISKNRKQAAKAVLHRA
jgi:hypothetical protein